jgi:L-gulonate 3-dehydrogenase
MGEFNSRDGRCVNNGPARMTDATDRPIAVIGGGSIGLAFAIVFARAGRPVRLHEPDLKRRGDIPAALKARLDDLGGHGLLGDAPDETAGRVTLTAELAATLEGVAFVEECAPEKRELKQSLFAELDRLAPADAVLASASSAITASAFAESLPGRHRVLVTHPGNPPFLIPVVELVPAPFTDAKTVEVAAAILKSVGMEPVVVRKEIEGFVFNRLQGALLREAYCLVRDGVVSVEELDRVVRDGLGLRWSVIGPFETVDLNTRGGIAAHAERLGPAYARMGAERGQHDPWTPELVAKVAAERRKLLPLDQWEDRVAWRDRKLMALVRDRKAAK